MDLRLIPYPSANFGLLDGCENLAAVPDPALVPNFYSALFSLHGTLHTLLRDLRPVDALVSDAIHVWTTALPAEHGIPRFIFQVTGLFPLCIENDIYLHRPYESVSSLSEPFSITGFPHPVKLTRATMLEAFNTLDMPGLLREYELNSYGPIRADLSRLSNVVELDFGQNNLSGDIPPELSNCSSLVTLLNPPREEIPAEIEASQPGEPSKNRRDLAGESGGERAVKALSASWALRRGELEKREEERVPERRLWERERTWRERMTRRAAGRMP